MKLFLSGFPGCGKSTMGKILSQRLMLPFFDTDVFLGEVKTLYQNVGEEIFRNKEYEVLQTLPKENAIVALGGGTLFYPLSLEFIKTSGKVVYLKTSFSLLFDRLQKRGFPTFIDFSQPLQSLQQLAEKRFFFYEQVADFIIDMDALTQEDVINKLSQWYGQ